MIDITKPIYNRGFCLTKPMERYANIQESSNLWSWEYKLYPDWLPGCYFKLSTGRRVIVWHASEKDGDPLTHFANKLSIAKETILYFIKSVRSPHHRPKQFTKKIHELNDASSTGSASIVTKIYPDNKSGVSMIHLLSCDSGITIKNKIVDIHILFNITKALSTALEDVNELQQFINSVSN